MHSYLPLTASFGCALCNGIAAILQKISAEKEKKAMSLDASLMVRLFSDKPYITGVGLDIIGWLLTLYAVHYLPLFLVESIIAGNIAITALVERFIKRTDLNLESYLAIFVIISGLALVSFTASSQKVHQISATLKFIIVISPILICAAGAAVARRKEYASAIGLAILAGLAFGDTSIIGRIFNLSTPLWHTVYSPLIVSLVASGALGITLFSVALQRASATTVNALMTGAQILVPAATGVIFLGDRAYKGLWYLAVMGTVLTLAGVYQLGLRSFRT